MFRNIADHLKFQDKELQEERTKQENLRKDFKDLCEKILETSIHWTGVDEEKNPGLKTIRTLAGEYLRKYH